MHGACAARPRIISIATCSVVWGARGNGMSSLLSILYDNPRNASREQLSTSALFGQKTFQHAASAARQADYSACGMEALSLTRAPRATRLPGSADLCMRPD